ncbi:amidase family protein [Bacillus sp. NEB1478]|uniref:amidase family protein n=1 Tax=Bacillus sp. NEB1478 TaxID=3073816 RepID=UPI002873933A|nr:amidase family protein [Bacillus sp. NEB1478]WNB90213.1 amidase family protein [Bacillus sp. NEB1478]
MKQINQIRTNELTLDELILHFENGELSSVGLVKNYLERIAAFDKAGPCINSVLEVNPEALFIAKKMDHERSNGKIRGPLHGVPVIIKDNIDSADQMHTSAGSLVLENHYAEKDAWIVKKLRDAGAVILGKANMTEWANFMAYDMPNGYSSRGGQVLNPYGPGVHDVSGSSSGSAASVACNFTMLAVGTETAGSILCPAGNNNIVGIKPTVGLVSRTGIIPISISQDTAGPMARNVKDAAKLLEVLAGYDEDDSATHSATFFDSYTDGLEKATLKRKRLGVTYNFCIRNLTDTQKTVFDESLSLLKKEGAEIIYLEKISPLENENFNYKVLLHEFKSGINNYLKTVSSALRISTLSDIIEYNKQNKEACLVHNQELLEESNQTDGTLTSPDYLNARLNDLKYSQVDGIDQVMKEHQLDALISPNDVWYGIPAKAGYPSISVPSGFDDNGLPLSIVLTAGAFSEKILIEIAYAYEQVTQYRVPIEY